MKLPIIRQFYQNHSPEDLEKTLEILESYTEFRNVPDDDMHTVGEMITNICGALEVHAAVKNGHAEKDALNDFAKKVMGSIDR